MARKAEARATEEHDEPEGESGDTDGQRRGATRGIWSGSISFGLLQIPISLHTAERRSETIHFRMLDKHDMAPIRYERVNAQTGKHVEWKDIVKGFEYEPDNFVVLDAEDLKKANVRATQTIDIQDFVPADQIDPAFFETPYYVVPQKRATKAYTLLREALRKKNAVAVATFVLRTREHLVALMPVGDAIMLEVLRFGHELRRADDVPLPSPKEASIGDREMRMAEQLIEGMMTDFAPAKYKDRYFSDVMKIIEEKAKTGATKHHNDTPRGSVATDVVDLLDLLKRSVAQKGKAGAANDDRAAKAGSRRQKSPQKASSRRSAKKHEAA